MSIERRFLGWRRPALHLAAEYLYDHFRQQNRWDLSSVVVALPGARAGRRLRELLALKAAELAAQGEPVLLMPPRIATTGELPEILCLPQSPVATDIDLLLAWAEALRRLPTQSLRHLFPGLSQEPEPAVLYHLAGELAAIDQELAAECVTSDQLSAYCADHGQPGAVSRWQAFAELQTLFRDILAGDGRISRDQARADSLKHRRLRPDLTVVILAGADLPAITRKILSASPSRIVALIHAPEEEAEGFDHTG